MDHATARAAARSPLFAKIVAIDGALIAKSLDKGRIITEADGARGCVGLLVEGAVDAYSVAADGRRTNLATLGPGDAFGICSLYADAPMPTVLRCRTACRAAFVSKSRLRALMGRDAELAARYACLCNEKIAFLIRRIEELTVSNGADKVLFYLRAHADRTGKAALPGTRDEWARRLGMSRTALFREIDRLKKEGVVFSRGRDLYVSDRSGTPCAPRARHEPPRTHCL
ncbi:MAG: Crp/Fnr family transcriptional regulator [Slackia sp.]|nr:Crp/Fnr family transcriptional regulator [Slackia sp.]